MNRRKIMSALMIAGMMCCLKLTSCKNDDVLVIAESADVPGLTSFMFSSAKNGQLTEDIVFEKGADNTYRAEVPYGIQLNSVVPSFDFRGKVKYNGRRVENNKTAIDVPDDFVLEFDKEYVIFRIKRTFAIPVLHVATAGGQEIVSKDDYLNCSVKLEGKNLFEDFQTDEARIRGRGNSTWKYYDKKPYRIKLDKKAPLLGMKEAKDWVLLANYRDPTDMMNAVVFDMARYMEMPYTNSNRFVELYVNNEYLGLYQLTEQIQQGENRVNVNKDRGLLLSLDLDDGPDLSPGTSDNFRSEIYGLPVAIKNPEDLTSTEIAGIKDDFAQIEQLIRDRNYPGLEARMNVRSMIDFLIIQELTRNVELVAPRSMYLHRDVDGIYHFGPVWDFDGGFAFNWASMTNGHDYFGSQSWLMGSRNPATHPSDAYNHISDFFVRMFGNSQFLQAYKSRWAQLNPGMLDYCLAQLEQYELHYTDAMVRDARRWPIGKDHQEEIAAMKQWLTERANSYTQILEDF